MKYVAVFALVLCVVVQASATKVWMKMYPRTCYRCCRQNTIIDVFLKLQQRTEISTPPQMRRAVLSVVNW